MVRASRVKRLVELTGRLPARVYELQTDAKSYFSLQDDLILLFKMKVVDYDKPLCRGSRIQVRGRRLLTPKDIEELMTRRPKVSMLETFEEVCNYG